jgi:dUTP pyrophosphatase
MELYLAPTSDSTRALYTAIAETYMSKPYEERDAGLDACVAEEATIAAGATGKLMLGVRAAAWDPDRRLFRAFWLLPRSSISKTPLRMANSVGLIDAGYRGQLMGAVDGWNGSHACAVGDRYFQITAADLMPWEAIHIVSEIPGGPTKRGEGGFGSTGVSVGMDGWGC